MGKLFILSLFLLCAFATSQDFLPSQELGMDLQKCFSDVMSLKTELQAFLTQGSISLDAMLAEYAKLKPIFASLKSDCLFGLGENNLGSNMLQCAIDFANLAGPIASFVADIVKKDVSACIQDLTKVLGGIGPIVKDCFQ